MALGLLFYFRISEPAPVRLASLRAERAYNHWKGSDKVKDFEAGLASAISKDDKNRYTTRSRFQDELFYI